MKDLRKAHARAVEILGRGKAIGPAELSELASLREELSTGPKLGNNSPYVAYPDIHDPKFASKLVAKREFAEHAIDLSDKGRRGCARNSSDASDAPDEFELTRTQIIVRNFLAPGTPYNGALLFHGVGVGKCHGVDTPILMFDGTIKIVQDVIVGDQLMGDDSTPRTVLSLASGLDELYDVVSEHEKYTVNEEHILCLKGPGNETVEMSVSDYLDLGTLGKTLAGYRTAVEFPERPLPAEPYFVGCYIGGKLEIYRTFLDQIIGHEIGHEIGLDDITHELCIPHLYKCNSAKNRSKLLVGLLDSNGSRTFDAGGHRLADDVMFLCRSLGVGCHKVGSRVFIADYGSLDPGHTSYDITVQYRKYGRYYGFTLDGNSRYLMGDFTVTHNTCSAVTVAEQCLNMGAHTKVLVVTRPGLRENFRKTVFDISKVPRKPDGTLDYARSSQCTGTAYPDRIPDKKSISTEQVESKIDRIIRHRYEFMGVGEFANVVEALGSGPATLAVERLRQRFSNTVIIVDEAHNLRIGGKESEDESGKRVKRATPALRRVLRCTENVKLLLLTATPMFNRSADVIDLINLLLANDKRPPIKTSDIFDKEGALTKDGEARLRAASRGYISYAAVDDPFSFPMRMWPSGRPFGTERKPSGRDHDVLRPTDVPRTDIRGDPIPPNMRLHADNNGGIEIITSPLGSKQRDVYLKVEEKLRTVPNDVEDEDEIDEDDRQVNAASALYTGLQTCNIAFPNSLKFDGCFKKRPIGSGGVQLEYRPNVPRFLEPSKLPLYAPKIAAIVRRIQSSKGIVMVYSRFLSAGLIPIAIALEHLGFKRFESAQLLSGGVATPPHTPPFRKAKDHDNFRENPGGEKPRDNKPGAGVPRGEKRQKKPKSPRWGVWGGVATPGVATPPGTKEGGVWGGVATPPTYAIISGNREYRTDETRTLEALKCKENVNGNVIKVILVSDRGSEGIDLRYVREVHVLEPWFHLNKIEQVVGRAARFCSHSALPQEERNLTVFLHATTKGSGTSETVDLRAYRLAEHKNTQIRKVENVLRSVSIDCKLRELGTSSMLSDAAKTRVTMRTSQGWELRDVPLHHLPRQHDSLTQGMCESPPPPPNLDESTYDPTGRHAYHHATFSNMLINYFVKTGRVSASFDDLLNHAMATQSSSPDEVKERLSTELAYLLKSGKEIEGPHGGRVGKMIHRGNLYMFQPFDEDTQVLTDVERAARKRRSPLALDASLLIPPPYTSGDAENSEGRQSRSLRAAEAALIGLDSDVTSLLSRTHMTSGPYRNVAVDFVVERLPHARLVRLATACVMNPAVLNLSDRLLRERGQAFKSLRSAGKILPNDPTKGHVVTLVSPYMTDGRVVRIDTNTGVSKEEVDPRAIKDSAKMKRRLINKDVVGAVVILPNEGRAVFKVLEDRLAPGAPQKRDDNDVRALTDGGRGSGCVCHQSSILSTDRLRELIATECRGEPVAIAASDKVQDKRALCELYELVLRKHRLSGLVP